MHYSPVIITSMMPDKGFLTLEKAIELGEYEPEFLSQFKEFRNLSRYSQFQLVRQAIKNREQQLRLHYAEINNQLDFRLKPELKKALKNIEQKLADLSTDEEKLFVEYS